MVDTFCLDMLCGGYVLFRYVLWWIRFVLICFVVDTFCSDICFVREGVKKINFLADMFAIRGGVDPLL